MTRIYSGWKRDPVDPRDHLFALTAPASIPAVVDLSPKCSPVENQGQLGACTGNSIVGAMEYLDRNFKSDTIDLSRLFVYYNERVMEGTVKTDSGAVIRDGIKSLAKLGVCPESECPYDVRKFTVKPSAKAYKDALPHRITSYERLSTLMEMQACLAAGFPFVFGFEVFASFESDAVAKTGIVPMPLPKEQQLGGHAVCAVGYDINKGLMKVRNSWGAGWGDKGYFYMPFDYITNSKLASDFWTIRK